MGVIKDKKGFTLIELLAVIVILAVIILIAASNIGGMTTTARKNVLAVEGNTMVDVAKTAYQLAVLEGDITTGSACFSLGYLYNQNLIDKGRQADGDKPGDGYTGSVLVEENEGQYTYTFWISNGSYKLEEAPSGATGKIAKDGDSVSENCNGKKSLVFKANGTTAEQG